MAALAGNLVDFTIGEVLAMIAASRKTGLLAVTGGSWDGRVWFEGGGIVAADSLGDSDVDIAVFNISRLRGPAGFGFEISSDLPPQGGNPRPVEEVLARAEDLGHLWREVVATLPSRQVGLELSTQLRDAEVTLSAAEWELVTAVAGTGWLGGVAGLLSQGEFSLSLAVKGLVDRGLVVVRPDRVGDPGQQDPGHQDSGQQDPGDQERGDQERGDQERGEQDPGGGDGGRGRLEELGGDGGRGRLEELVAAAAAATGPPEAALAAIGSPPAAITPELVTVGAQAEVASFGGADRGSAAPRPPAQAVIEVGGAYGPRSMDAPSIEALGVVARSALLPDPEGVAEVELVVLHRDPPEPGGSPSAGSPTGDLPPRGSSAADPPSSGEGQRSGTRASSGSSVELPRRPAGGTPRTNADRNALMRELRDL